MVPAPATPPSTPPCTAGDEPTAKKARLGSGVTAPAGKRLPSAVVLDIEGTIASISYVTDVLFPYARQRMRWARRRCPARASCEPFPPPAGRGP